jgi:hypothetical protein
LVVDDGAWVVQLTVLMWSGLRSFSRARQGGVFLGESFEPALPWCRRWWRLFGIVSPLFKAFCRGTLSIPNCNGHGISGWKSQTLTRVGGGDVDVATFLKAPSLSPWLYAGVLVVVGWCVVGARLEKGGMGASDGGCVPRRRPWMALLSWLYELGKVMTTHRWVSYEGGWFITICFLLFFLSFMFAPARSYGASYSMENFPSANQWKANFVGSFKMESWGNLHTSGFMQMNSPIFVKFFITIVFVIVHHWKLYVRAIKNA